MYCFLLNYLSHNNRFYLSSYCCFVRTTTFHVQVQQCIRLCGHQLLHDKRTRAAQVRILATDAAEAQQLLSLGGLDRHPLRNAAQQAQQGRFERLEDFATAVKAAAAAVCANAEHVQARVVRPQHAGSAR